MTNPGIDDEREAYEEPTVISADKLTPGALERTTVSDSRLAAEIHPQLADAQREVDRLTAWLNSLEIKRAQRERAASDAVKTRYDSADNTYDVCRAVRGAVLRMPRARLTLEEAGDKSLIDALETATDRIAAIMHVDGSVVAMSPAGIPHAYRMSRAPELSPELDRVTIHVRSSSGEESDWHIDLTSLVRFEDGRYVQNYPLFGDHHMRELAAVDATRPEAERRSAAWTVAFSELGQRISALHTVHVEEIDRYLYRQFAQVGADTHEPIETIVNALFIRGLGYEYDSREIGERTATRLCENLVIAASRELTRGAEIDLAELRHRVEQRVLLIMNKLSGYDGFTDDQTLDAKVDLILRDAAKLAGQPAVF